MPAVQPGTPAYCTELTANELKSALRSAEHPRANRDALLREFMAAGGRLTHDEIVTPGGDCVITEA